MIYVTKRVLIIVFSGLFAGCSTLMPTLQKTPNPDHAVRYTQQRKLFVFFDGTSNDWQARTNVRRLFELVAAQEDPARLCLWVEGVGTRGVLGKGLGVGMKSRILAGYDFLARNYRAPVSSGAAGDEIYVFGFSRGALEARALCGMLAHCGLYRPHTPESSEVERQKEKLPLDRIWKACRNLEEEANIGAGIVQRLQTNRAIVANSEGLRGERFIDCPVKFLGVWDTVPGTHFTQFNEEGEQIDHGKVTTRPHYKVKPYPNIERIAHALSMDDARSKFQPLLVGPPLIKGKPEVFEVWFPGAHSDIGGGYMDTNEMAGVSLQWMLELLGNNSLIPGKYKVYSNALGLVHHPELNFLSNFGSRAYQRILPERALVHESFLKRIESPEPPWESLDSDHYKYKQAIYRPDPAIREGGQTVKHAFLYKPLLSNGAEDPDRSHWIFDKAKFRTRFTIVEKEHAREKQTTGRPLAAAAAQINTEPAAALPTMMQATSAAASSIVKYVEKMIPNKTMPNP